MVERNEIYRRMSRCREYVEYVLVVEDSPREIVAWPCNADGDTYNQDSLKYITRAVFLETYEKVK